MAKRQSRSKLVKMVRHFHHSRGMDIDVNYEEDKLSQRIRLVTEEVVEFAEACLDTVKAGKEPENIFKEKILREMVDMVYTIVGTAATFGWDFDTAFERVHKANMTKTDEQIDGKIIKPEDFVEPSMEGLV